MTPDDHARAASTLFAAEKTQVQTELLSLAYPDMTMADAYAVQKTFVGLKLAQGRRVVGWKIGLTSKAMQAALDIDIPDSGVLLDNMAFADGTTIKHGTFIQPRVEAEIAFVMSADIGGEDVTHAQVLAATDHVCPALEILDTRILRRDPKTGQTRRIVDTIADNAANAGFVLGDARHPATGDLRWVGAIVKRNGEVEETGLGAGVLDDPVTAVVWLARRMAEYGEQIRAGQVILSGSFIRPLECPPGSRIAADFGTFGKVSVAFG